MLDALARAARPSTQSLDADRRPAARGRSTRARRPPTARPAPTTSRPASSRTSSRASRPCRATTSTARPAGTATACRSSSRSRRSSASPASSDIEAYGVAEFNARCRESVLRHVDAFEEMTERMGYWVDIDDPYRTMDPAYVESVWWALKQIHDKGLLVEDYRVAPYCPRCGTGLSDHELAQGYETVVDPSVYVRFPLTSGPLRRPGRAAGLDDDAVDAGVQHRRRRAPRRRPTSWPPTATRRWSWPSRCSSRCSARAGRCRTRFTGARHGALDLPAARSSWSSSRAADGAALSWCSPTTSPPRTAPAWCTSPPPSARTTWRSAARYGLPVVNPVRPDGHFDDDVPLVGGQFFKHADADLVEDLEARGLLFRHVAYEHTYPHCWRCHTALHVLRPAVLVRPHHRRSRTRCCARTRRPTGSPRRSSGAATATG